VAGAIVLLSVLLSIWVPASKWVAAAVGAGLTFAALSNTCTMGMLLSRLPYNKAATCDTSEVVRQLELAGTNRRVRPASAGVTRGSKDRKASR
jgi:hypothetical protein